MPILITGAKGMLGFDLGNHLREQGHEVIEWDLPERDITDVTTSIAEARRLKPETIFHLAAFTDVDGSQSHRADAYKVNTLGAWTMAIAARDAGAALVYMSTDYIFDGAKKTPYLENDKPRPLNYYGTTKWLGEQAVQRDARRHFICRTSWLFGRHGRNFVDAIIRLAQENESIDVVDDQRGSPTYTKDLVKALALFVGSKKYGTYHVTNSGDCTWFQFAKEIVRLAGLEAKVNSTTSDKYVRPAKRPPNSVLDNGLFQSRFEFVMPTWQEALKAYLSERGLLR